MIEITAEIRAFIDKAAAGVELAEDEYTAFEYLYGRGGRVSLHYGMGLYVP